MITLTNNQKINPWLEILFPVLVAIFLYFNVYQFDFVWDDQLLILKNPFLQQSTHFYKLFMSGFWDFSYHGADGSHYYRPLVSMMCIFEYHLWGAFAGGYHLVNLGFHIVSLILVWMIARKLGLSSMTRILSCLVFTLHPVQASTITFISCQGDLMAQMFSLLGILFWMQEGKIRWLSLVWVFIALLCKEVAIVTPIVMVFLDLTWGKKTIRNIKTWIPLLVWIPYIALRTYALKETGLLNFSNVYQTKSSYRTFLYITRVLFPFPISPGHLVDHVSWILLILFDLLYASIWGVILYLVKVRKNLLIGFLMGWFLFDLLPIVDWLGMGLRFSDQLMYLSMAPAAIVLGILFSRRRLFVFLFVPILIVMGILSFQQKNIWKNNITLWKNMLLFDPSNINNNYQYAHALKIGGFKDEGCKKLYGLLETAKKASDVGIQQGVLYDLGNCVAEQQPEAAEKYYWQALDLAKPNDAWIIRRNLVAVLISQNKNKDALEQAKIFSQEKPELFISWKQLGLTFLLNKNFSESLKALNQAALLNPNDKEIQTMIQQAQAQSK